MLSGPWPSHLFPPTAPLPRRACPPGHLGPPRGLAGVSLATCGQRPQSLAVIAMGELAQRRCGTARSRVVDMAGREPPWGDVPDPRLPALRRRVHVKDGSPVRTCQSWGRERKTRSIFRVSDPTSWLRWVELNILFFVSEHSHVILSTVACLLQQDQRAVDTVLSTAMLVVSWFKDVRFSCYSCCRRDRLIRPKLVPRSLGHTK